ncbi:MAG: ATP-dependent DNA ligase, partial [Candidatus Hodarchaeales archaeon]
GQKILLGWSSFNSVIKRVTKRTPAELKSFYTQYADFGSLVEFALEKRRPRVQQLDSFFGRSVSSGPLSIEDVCDFFSRIASLSGKGSTLEKKAQLSAILDQCSPLEGKYIARIITSDTRTGFREGLLLEAIALAFDRKISDVRYGYMVLSDVGELALVARNHNLILTEVSPKVFHPLRSMLATKVDSAEKVLESYPCVFVESKIDGFRAQLHVMKDESRIYSRNLEDVTAGFPEIIANLPTDMIAKFSPLILDGEIVSLVEGRPVFFQDLLTRIIGRKKITEKVKNVPCYFYMFDIILYKGENLLLKDLKQRKEFLNSIPISNHLLRVESNLLCTSNEIDDLFRQSIKGGFEGLMLKDPASKYLAGKRGKGWLKLKGTLPSLDLVIVAAEWGHGRRTGWLSNYHLAARAGESFQVVGKTFKGLTDEEFDFLTKQLKRLILKEYSYGVEVIPDIVVEVEYNNIQQSSKYASGMALRFARIKRIRLDKTIDEADTIETVRDLYNGQLKRQKRSN